jgi:C4-dicarboxylate transporter
LAISVSSPLSSISTPFFLIMLKSIIGILISAFRNLR